MDGINPTLAFAVLFFGLSGNGPEATIDPQLAAGTDDGSGCAAMMISGEAAKPARKETSAEALWSSAGEVALLPDVLDPRSADSAPDIENSELMGELALATPDQTSDPITRQIAPAGTSVLAAAAQRDPCEPQH